MRKSTPSFLPVSSLSLSFPCVSSLPCVCAHVCLCVCVSGVSYPPPEHLADFPTCLQSVHQSLHKNHSISSANLQAVRPVIVVYSHGSLGLYSSWFAHPAHLSSPNLRRTNSLTTGLHSVCCLSSSLPLHSAPFTISPSNCFSVSVSVSALKTV